MENGKDFLTQCKIGNSLVKMDDFLRIFFAFTQLNRFTFEASIIIKTGYALECLDFGGRQKNNERCAHYTNQGFFLLNLKSAGTHTWDFLTNNYFLEPSPVLL